MLLDQDSYGYEISKNIKERSDGKYIIKETTLYSAFNRLTKNGYIEAFVKDDETHGKKRKYYRITEEGRRYYQDKCMEWELTKEVINRYIKEVM